MGAKMRKLFLSNNTIENNKKIVGLLGDDDGAYELTVTDSTLRNKLVNALNNIKINYSLTGNTFSFLYTSDKDKAVAELNKIKLPPPATPVPVTYNYILAVPTNVSIADIEIELKNKYPDMEYGANYNTRVMSFRYNGDLTIAKSILAQLSKPSTSTATKTATSSTSGFDFNSILNTMFNKGADGIGGAAGGAASQFLSKSGIGTGLVIGATVIGSLILLKIVFGKRRQIIQVVPK